MPFRFLILFCLFIAAQCGGTLSTEHRSSRYVKLPVVRSTDQQAFADGYEDRRDLATVPVAKRSDVAYFAKLNVGTPPQPVSVQLDTGSFELWVNPDCSNLRRPSDVKFCNAAGHYDPSSSSSAIDLAERKSLTYGIGSATIQYFVDAVGLAGTGALLRDVQFGVAFETANEFSGILGIGHGENVTIGYKNVIDQLADQDVTNTKAFSLALGSKREQEGVIIFGGLDTAKFTGMLQTQRIIPASSSPDGVPRYWIEMKSLSITRASGTTKRYSNASIAVILDSGATLTLLPTRLANAIASDFGAGAIDAHGLYPVNCQLNNQRGTLNFGFIGVTISVSYREIVRESSSNWCYLGIGPSEDFVLLGDTVLRSAYAVFDQTNNAIHLAQYSNCGSNEREITADIDWASVHGDCEPPDFRSDNAYSDPLAQPPQVDDGPGSGSDANAGTSKLVGWRLGCLLIVWAVIHLADLEAWILL